jgi:Ca2+-binding RTX toxin-like protein
MATFPDFTTQASDQQTTALSITAVDAVKPEGDSGSTPFTFQITRLGNTTNEITVDYTVFPPILPSVEDGTLGVTPDDFGGTSFPSGTVTLASGERQQTFTVQVSGDEVPELDVRDEQVQNKDIFDVKISNPSNNATILTKEAFGEILNDDDAIIGFNDNEILEGTKENDYVFAGGGNDRIAVFSGNDRVNGDSGNDLIFGDRGNDQLEGNNDDDTIFGGQGKDSIGGNEGDDTLFGGQQADIINGGNGDDFLTGDLQEDTLIGGGGSDRFLLRPLSGTNIITDFEDGTDSLVLPDDDFPLQPNGLSFEDLTVTQTEDGTTISLNNEAIAFLTDVSATNITEDDFQQVSSF